MGLKTKQPNSMQQNPTLEANSHVRGLNIPHLLRNMFCALPCSQEPPTDPYPVLDAFNTHTFIFISLRRVF
jgi:hypothetical protein